MSANFIATFSLPRVTLSATAAFVGTGASFTLPKGTLTATLESNWLRASPILPRLQLTAQLQAGAALSAEPRLPSARLTAQFLPAVILSATPTLPKLRLSAQALIGGLLTAAPELPATTLTAQLRSDAALQAAFTLPRIRLSAELVTAASAAYRTWALNLRRNALTEYDNFDFNSYAIFNGQVLACGPAGVVVLGTQDLDGAAPIDAEWRTGQSDFGFSQHSRVPRLYAAGSQDGDLHFKVITKEQGARTYLLPWNHITEHTQRRVPIGKGPRSRFWQFGAANVAGSDFSTSSVMAYPTKLRRRVS